MFFRHTNCIQKLSITSNGKTISRFKQSVENLRHVPLDLFELKFKITSELQFNQLIRFVRYLENLHDKKPVVEVMKKFYPIQNQCYSLKAYCSKILINERFLMDNFGKLNCIDFQKLLGNDRP